MQHKEEPPLFRFRAIAAVEQAVPPIANSAGCSANGRP